MPEKQLFPLPVVLDQDGHELNILRRLNAGLTAEVYEGTLASSDTGAPLRVAVKIMKALEFPLARMRFLQESETLAFLMHLEEEADKEQLISLKVAPRYYGRGEYEGSPYIVMEFVDGKDIPSILEKEGRLLEKQALVVAWHLYRTLDILHTRLKRTYIDLKFDDLWWVGSAADGQLKLLDFGTLEDIKPTDTQLRGVRRDLLLGGVYLFSILTGRTISYSLGELGEPAWPLIHQMESNFSWGTGQLLRRLLHRNPSSRPVSAAAVAAELRTLVKFWSQPQDKLSTTIQVNLAEAETAAEQAAARNQPISTEGRDCAARARSALDIFHALHPTQDISVDIQRAEKALDKGNYMERGTALLKGRSFAAARKIFEEGIQWSDDPALLRRWAFLARAGEGISPTTFEKRSEEAVQALAAMGEAHWEIAQKRLGDLAKPAEDATPGFESEGLNFLRAESAFFALVEKAETARKNGEFEKAAAAYKAAQVELKKLPLTDARFITDEEVGDLSLLMDAMTVLAATSEQAAKKYQEARQCVAKGEWEACTRLAWEAYQADRSAPFRNKELNQIAQQALERAAKHQADFPAAVRTARQVAGVGVSESPMDLALSATWHLACHLDDAESALEARDGLGLQQAVTAAQTGAASDAALMPLITTLLARADSFAASSPALLQSLAAICRENMKNETAAHTLLEKAGQLEAKQRQERQSDIDGRLNQVNVILSPLSPEPGRLAAILQQAEEMASVWKGIEIAVLQDRLGRLEEAALRIEEIRLLAEASGYRLDEIARLHSVVEQGLAIGRAAFAGQEKAQREFLANQVASLSAERFEIDSLRQFARRAADVQIGMDVEQKAQEKLGSRLADFILRCYQVLAGEKDSEPQTTLRKEQADRQGRFPEKMDPLGAVKGMAGWASRALDELGEDAWQQVKQMAEERQEHARAGLEPVRMALEAGDLPRLAAELDRSETEFGASLEWRKLKQDLLKATAWNAWTRSRVDVFGLGDPNPDLLRDLRAYLRSDLPERLWHDAGIPTYLKKARETAKQEAAALLKRKDDESNDAGLVNALAQWLGVEWTSRLAAPDSQARGKWNRLEWLRSLYRNPNLEQAPAALPDDIELALKSFSPADWQAVRAAEKKAQADQAKTRQNTSRALVIIPAVLVIGALLFFGGKYLFTTVIPAMQATETPVATQPPVTETALPTEPPTEAPTPEPIPTEPPTPIPASAFVAPETLYPALPVAGDGAWLLNLEARTDPFIQSDPAMSDTAFWKRDQSHDANNPMAGKDYVYYTETGNVTVTWQMDQPFEAGTYAVYVLDTDRHSLGTYTYSVLLDGAPQTPARGQNTVTFEGVTQKVEAWLPVGFYTAQHGQRMSVQVTVGALTADTPFAVDRLLIVKLSANAQTMLDLLPVDRPLASLLDDGQTRFYELNAAGEPVSVANHGEVFTDALAWSDGFTSRNLAAPLTVPLWVEWQPAGLLPAGTYEVYVWVPSEHATIPGSYAVLLDGKPIQFNGEEVRTDTGAEEYLRPLNQADHSAEWWSLGTWTLASDGSVSVRLVIPAGNTGAIGVDAVALVRVGE